MKVAIVGGVAGGASAATRLRRLEESAEIRLFERGEFVSFANCGLPYYKGGEIQSEASLTLQTPESLYLRHRIDVRTRSTVTRIDTKAKLLTVVSPEGEYTDSYDFLLLAPGAQPIRPPLPGAEDPDVFTLRTIPDARRIRQAVRERSARTAVIVGAGSIGLELAETLTKAGVTVTVLERTRQPLPSLDPEMAADIAHHLMAKGVRLLLNTELRAIERDGDAFRVLAGSDALAADIVVLALGVRPETELAAAAGIPVNARGAILVDAHMRTQVADVYAVGDAVEVAQWDTQERISAPLAGPANRQGRIAADNICGIPSRYTGTQGSAIVRIFDMTAAATGLNEKTLRALGRPYGKAYTYSPNHATYYPGAKFHSIKTLYDTESGRLLGAQVVGFEGSDKRCDVLATAIRLRATAAELCELELCYAPHYSSAKDPVNLVGFVIENVRSGRVREFYWDDVDALPRDGSVFLLDVRTRSEHALGSIPGFVNIPLDELRERLEEIPKKPVYVHCQSGQRSYVACRILAQQGYACYNLAGGYRLYHSVFQTQ